MLVGRIYKNCLILFLTCSPCACAVCDFVLLFLQLPRRSFESRSKNSLPCCDIPAWGGRPRPAVVPAGRGQSPHGIAARQGVLRPPLEAPRPLLPQEPPQQRGQPEQTGGPPLLQGSRLGCPRSQRAACPVAPLVPDRGLAQRGRQSPLGPPCPLGTMSSSNDSTTAAGAAAAAAMLGGPGFQWQDSMFSYQRYRGALGWR